MVEPLDAIRRMPCFRDSRPEDVSALIERGEARALEAGERLIREGDLDVRELYLLLEGTLRIESEGELILRLERPGSVVGELAPLDTSARSADVIAEVPTRVLALDAPSVSQPDHTPVAALYYKMLAHNLAAKLKAEAVYAREQIQKVRLEAKTDRLTGLANRRGLDEHLAAMAAACDAGDPPFTLVLCDVDHFKHYNDTHGHQPGDHVLSALGDLFADRIGERGLAARYGGEEFVLVLPQTGLEAATQFAEQLRLAISENIVDGAELQPGGRLTATFGVAEYAAGMGVSRLMSRADERLYAGKAAGRDRVVSA